MTEQKPNCSTCTIKICPDDTPSDDFGASGEESVKLLKKVGCISNPDARAYLMAPVLKELEKLTQLGEIDGDEHNNYISGIYEAISLIKNGVKND